MDDYLLTFRKMISLRGLADHTIISYSTYVRVYLEYGGSFLSKSNTPQQADGVSSLMRSRAAGYLTLATFAKCSCKHGTWLIARGNKTLY